MGATKKNRKSLLQTLETERFKLVPVGLLQALRITNSWRSDPDILAGIYYSSKPRSLLRWIRSGPVPDNASRFVFAIVPKGSEKPIGAFCIRFRGYRSAYDIIALHDRNWWRKGVGQEVRAKLMNHFFKHGDIERYFGSADARNIASVTCFRRLGFDHIGTWHRHRQNPVTGEIIDIAQFEIFRDAWENGPFAEKTGSS